MGGRLRLDFGGWKGYLWGVPVPKCIDCLSRTSGVTAPGEMEILK